MEIFSSVIFIIGCVMFGIAVYKMVIRKWKTPVCLTQISLGLILMLSGIFMKRLIAVGCKELMNDSTQTDTVFIRYYYPVEFKVEDL